MTKEKKNTDSLNQYLETEAAFLEEYARQHGSKLQEMDFDLEAGYAQLMEAVAKREQAGNPAETEAQAEERMAAWKRNRLGDTASEKTEKITDGSREAKLSTPDEKEKYSEEKGDKEHGRKCRKGRRNLANHKASSRKIAWRTMVSMVAILVLVVVLDTGTIGQKIYRPESVVEHKDGEIVIKVNNEEWIETEVEEDAIYQEIEERLGIRALRLGYKPAGMELYWVEILEETGEARVQYAYKGQILMIYICRDFFKSEINIKSNDKRESIDTTEIFALSKEVDVFGIANGVIEDTYFVELEVNSTYFFIEGTLENKEFLTIIENIYLKSV
ncbi:MAG: DUF4367 domain-containing protein [Lachnospiraceae bacterium]|nr:DUF4367 domain-containing protein [Lachnospiraceae bacterium]